MRKRWTYRLAAVFVISLLAALTACGGSGTPAAPAAPAASPAPAAPAAAAPAAAAPAATPAAAAKPAAPQRKVGGVLNVALDGEPPTLDWASSTTGAARQVGYHAFEQLFTFDDKYGLIPQLAKDYSVSADGKVYTINLRQGVKFHNGDEMKAEDVKVSVERFMKINPRKGDVAAFKEIRVKGDYAVELELKQAQGAFLSAFSMPVPGAPIMPAKSVKDVEATKLTMEQLVGTGPFMIKEWVPASHVKLVKFAGYVPDDRFPGPTGLGGKRTPLVDEVILKPVKEPSARMAGLEAGDFDYASALPANEYPRMQRNDKLVSQILSPEWWITIQFNHTKAPFNNVKIRQALLAGLDNDEIMLAVGERPEFFRVDPSLYYQEQIWHNDIGARLGLFNQKDVTKAKQLLAEGGYNNEKVRILTNTNYDWMYKASQVAAEQMKKIGFNVELIVLDWPTVISTRTNKDAWEIYYTGQSPRFDPSGFGYMLHSTATGAWGYSNQEMDRLLDAGLVEPDVAKRQKIYEEVQRIYYEDVPSIKHGDIHGLMGHQSYVKGSVPWYSVRFWDVWLDK